MSAQLIVSGMPAPVESFLRMLSPEKLVRLELHTRKVLAQSQSRGVVCENELLLARIAFVRKAA